MGAETVENIIARESIIERAKAEHCAHFGCGFDSADTPTAECVDDVAFRVAKDVRIATLVEAAQLMCHGCHAGMPLGYAGYNEKLKVSFALYHWADDGGAAQYCLAEKIILPIMKEWACP